MWYVCAVCNVVCLLFCSARYRLPNIYLFVADIANPNLFV